MQTAETTLEDCRSSDKDSPDPQGQTKSEFQGIHDINPHGATISPKVKAEAAQEMSQHPYTGPASGYQPPPGYAAPQGYATPAQEMSQHPHTGSAPRYQPPPGYAAPQGYATPAQEMSQHPHTGSAPGYQPPPGYAAPQGYARPAQEMSQHPHTGSASGYQPPPGYAAPQGYARPAQEMSQHPHTGSAPGYQPPPGYAAPQGYATPMPDELTSAHQCKCHGNTEDANLKHDLNRYGQLLDAVNGIMNGKPDIPKIAGILDSYDPAFWKGAIIGVVSSLIVTNDTVKGVITGTISKAFGKDE